MSLVGFSRIWLRSLGDNCSAANLADAVGFCFHDSGAGSASGILVDLVADRLRKILGTAGLRGAQPATRFYFRLFYELLSHLKPAE